MTDDPKAIAEREAIVAYLRAATPAMKGGWRQRLTFVCAALRMPRWTIELVYEVCADAIERGDHLRDAG